MNMRGRRALASREERAAAAGENGSGFLVGDGVGDGIGDGAGGGPVVDEGLERAKEVALEHGYVLRRESRHRRVQPWREGGFVRYSCRMSANVRDALEGAKRELDLHGSEIVELAVIEFLLRKGLRVEGVTPGQYQAAVTLGEPRDRGVHQGPVGLGEAGPLGVDGQGPESQGPV